MREEQYDKLNKQLKRLATSDRTMHWRLVASGADKKPILIVAQRDSGLDAEVRVERQSAKDKRMAAGRAIKHNGDVVFGIDMGNLPEKEAEKLVTKKLANDAKLMKRKPLLSAVKVVSGEEWVGIQPGSVETAGGGDDIGLSGDDLGIDTTVQTTDKGKAASKGSAQKGSDYSSFLEALERWHVQFGNGHSFTTGDYQKALAAIDEIETSADAWLSKHKKKLLESSKTTSRREQVQLVRTQVAEGRRKLEAFAVFGRARASWDRAFGDKDGLEISDLSRARVLLEPMEMAARTLVDVAGSSATRAQSAVKAVDDARQWIRDAALADSVTGAEQLEHLKAEGKERRKRLKAEIALEAEWREQAQESLDAGRYTRGDRLSHGAYGEVYSMKGGKKDPVLVSKKFLAKGSRDVVVSETKREAKKEWDVYQQLGAHPNIARCLALTEIDGNGGLVMEAIMGGTLNNAIAKGQQGLADGTVSAAEYWGAFQHMLRGAIEGLAHMESHGLGHSDIKPDNLMIDAVTGETKLIDMGSATPIGDAYGPGTAGYVGKAAGETSGSAHDMFSIGSTAYKSGENKDFRYHVDGPMNPFALMYRATEWMASGVQALRSLPDTETKEPGFVKADTAYTEFVNALMDGDPANRPSLREALALPFLADPLLQRDEAIAAVKKLASL